MYDNKRSKQIELKSIELVEVSIDQSRIQELNLTRDLFEKQILRSGKTNKSRFSFYIFNRFASQATICSEEIPVWCRKKTDARYLKSNKYEKTDSFAAINLE